MLQIKNISKQYKTGELVQNALNDVSLNFRDNEFVSVLGPSGSGKTTLLNIIGGLDRYDSGDLIINHVSTKDYKDRDWDSYRNHTIGFVFQSYNLIPHQTVLANVELALTIGGISKAERRKRALDALEEVGLRDQAHKKPNQMSGGQMQRVAIARALVNNPDILLADEPTGALDTETSVQVMELLKEVAKDRLVIMVTHNPELAETYSTRIVRLKDGKIIGDSNEFIPEQDMGDSAKYRNLGTAAMSFVTALSLSLNNLMTKKARTILTAFAGSIGIIGIALILSLSTGFHNYINQIQEDTLSSYPLSIYKETADITSALLSMVSDEGKKKEKDIVEEQQYLTTMFASVGTNDMKSLKSYLEENQDEIDEMVTLTRYQYSVNPVIFTEDCNNKITQLNPSEILTAMSGGSAQSSVVMSSNPMSSIFSEMIDDRATLEEQYEVLAGRWPEKYDEVILVLSEPNGITDILVYGLGLRSNDEFRDMLTDLMAGEKVEKKDKPLEFTYEELMKTPLKLVDESDTYKYNSKYDVYEDMAEDEAFMEEVYENAIDLNIVGVVCVKEGESSTVLSPGVAYTKALTDHVMNQATKSEIVKKQLEDQDVNVFSGKRFDDEENTGLDFQDMISVDEDMLSAAFGTKIDEDDVSDMTKGYMDKIQSSITADTSKAKNAFDSTLTVMLTDLLNDHIDENYNAAMKGTMLKASDVNSVVDNYMKSEDCKKLLANLEKDYLIPQDTFSTMYAELMKGLLGGYVGMAAVNQDNPSPSVPENVAPEETVPEETTSEETVSEEITSEETVPEETTPEETIPEEVDLMAPLTKELVVQLVPQLISQDAVSTASDQIAAVMTEAVMKKDILTEVGELTGELMGTMASAFNVDPDAISGAFQFNMDEEDLSRLMSTMSASGIETNADTNLLLLGYQDVDEPSTISFYFKDFEAKDKFIEFLDDYNKEVVKEDEEKEIKYTDLTGILMSSVSTIVDSVTYVLIAFVSISLIVSSIMIGIITYISVLERTKEIGVLRAIGASKRNISSIFNAETFIVGLFSGLLGIGVTLALVPPINYVIHSVSGNTDVNAMLPWQGAATLVILSVILTLISGLIPSKQAAKKDPVLALRSE